MAPSYRYLQHTSEVSLRAYGANLAEAMAGAAQALFAVMVDLRGLRQRRWMEVTVESSGVEDLLVEWLNELLFRWETTGVLLRRFEVEEVSETRVRARCGGEPYDPQRHRLKLEVKAATYHQVRVLQGKEGCTVYVVLDV